MSRQTCRGAVFTTIQTAAKTKSLPDNDNDDCHYCHASVTISKNPDYNEVTCVMEVFIELKTQSIIKLSIFLCYYYSKHNNFLMDVDDQKEKSPINFLKILFEEPISSVQGRN